MVVCSPARTAPLQAAVWKGLVEFAPVKQGHPEGNCGYLTIMLVVVTENPLILLTSWKASSDQRLLEYDHIFDRESPVSPLALYFNY